MMNIANDRMRFWLDGIGQAALALKDNRLRTVLSILGISIGIAAVMAVGTISKSGHFLIIRELETFGLKSVWVWRIEDNKDPNRSIRTGTGIEVADVDVLRSGCCPAISRVTPTVYAPMRLPVRNGNRFSNAQINGVGSDYAAINNDILTAGRNFSLDDIVHHREIAIIGTTVSEDLFGTSSPVGQEIRVGEKRYTVIGLLKRKSRDFLASIGSAGGQDANNRILLPYTTLQLYVGSKDIQLLQAEAVDLGQADLAVAQIIQLLEHQHSHHYSYKGETMAQYITTSDRILQGVSLIGIVAASISLFVGGLGIMNIVSTSVLERTREIGLRKAVGASRRHIQFQFLMECVILSTVGGILGLVIGSLASIGLAIITGFPLTPSWSTVTVAILVSIIVGLVSGYYPARRAASLNPVNALRYE